MPSLYAVMEEDKRNEELYRKKKSKENKKLKKKIIELIEDAIVKMHDDKKDYAENLLHEAQILMNDLKL